jgi:ubiquinol-cytochrome c reductase cytochrome b subunit
VGSNNPDGIEIKKHKGPDGIPLDGIPFHPYYTVKDIVGVVVFLFVFASVMFFTPEVGGYFLEHANFVPANPLATPEHIAPVWYFTPFYTVLRAVPDPFGGVVAMGLAVAILFVLPWIDRNPVKSWRYRSPLHKANLILFAAVFIVLGILGTKPVSPVAAEMAVRFSEAYFIFFVVLWFSSRPRSKGFSLAAFVVLMGLVTLYDLSRVTSDTAGLAAVAWLIPALYLAAMVLLPVVTDLNAEKPVPERVTS